MTYTLTLGDKDTPASLIGEIRQRLHMNASAAGTDPSTINDTLITQRINVVQSRWAAIFWKHGAQDKLVGEEVITLASGETEKLTSLDVRVIWQILKESAQSDGRDYPVTIVPARQLYQYIAPQFSRTTPDGYFSRYFAAIMDDPDGSGKALIRFAATSNANLPGDYTVQHYKEPDPLALTSDTLFVTAEFYDTFVNDVVASIIADGGELYKARQLKEYVDRTLAELVQLKVPKDQTGNAQIQDAMGYQSGHAFNYWLH